MSQDNRVNPFSMSALRFHVPLLIGVVGCLAAGWFELSRAREGRTVAWVYAFEWPGFAIVGIIIWWRIITNRGDSRPGGPTSATPEHDPAADDPGLAAWQQYLADTRSRERAGGSSHTD